MSSPTVRKSRAKQRMSSHAYTVCVLSVLVAVTLLALRLSEGFSLSGFTRAGGRSLNLNSTRTKAVSPVVNPALSHPKKELDGAMRDAIKKLLEIQPDEKFLWYSPHSGFGNQLVAFRNALRLAGILNRTLVVPPAFPHHFDVLLGDCIKGRVESPNRVRNQYWKVLMYEIQSPFYTSMADVIDIASLSSGLVRTIDLRLFLALKCGLNVTTSLMGCSWCKELVSNLEPKRRQVRRSVWKDTPSATEADFQHACSAFLGINPQGKVKSRSPISAYAVMRDCRNTIFMYSRHWKTKELVTRFDPKVRTSSCPNGLKFAYTNRMAVIRNMAQRRGYRRPELEPINAWKFFGQNPNLLNQTTITFGSLFYYFDFSIPMNDKHADAISCATEFLAFTPPFMKQAQAYAKQNISHPNLCLHFRGGDLFFARMAAQSLATAKLNLKKFRKTRHLSNTSKYTLFLITDLTSLNWKLRFKRGFEPLGYKIKFADDLNQQLLGVKLKVLSAGRGVLTNRVSLGDVRRFSEWHIYKDNWIARNSKYLANAGVVLEQAACSCADLGFIGNGISSISKNIRHLRYGKVCSRENL